MTEADIYDALNEIFADVFFRDDLVLTPATTAKDVEGWDSFKQVEIILATSERFRIKLTNREVDSLKSVGDLARLVGAKVTT